MLTRNIKVYLSAAAAIGALVIGLSDLKIEHGTGIIVATLAAGAGYLLRDVNDEIRTTRNICQAYAALIEAHFEEINDMLSDAELDRFLVLAPATVKGDEQESVGGVSADPFESLPDIRSHLHLLSPATVRFLTKWRSRGMDLFAAYAQLGTKALCATGHDRLAAHFVWIQEYRNKYRDIGYTCLLLMRSEMHGLDINLSPHEAAGATKLVSNELP